MFPLVMTSLWFLYLLAGVLVFVAASLFFAMPKNRFFVALFGNRGARIFYRLLGLGLVVLGLYVGKANQWALRGPPPYEIVIHCTWPGHHDARETSSAIAAPLGAVFNRLPAVTQVVSETRPDGSYRCSIAFHPKFDPEQAKRSVDSAINEGYSYLPSDLRSGLIHRGNLAPVRESDKIGLAIIRKSTDGEEAPLWELARAVARRLVDEHALSAIDVLDDQIPSGSAPPVLVVRVGRWQAVRITGSPPANAWLIDAPARCLELAEMERAKRPDADAFATEILEVGSGGGK